MLSLMLVAATSALPLLAYGQTPQPGASQGATVQTPSAPGQTATLSAAALDSLQRAITILREEMGVVVVPDAGAFAIGNVTVPIGTVRDDVVAVYKGNISIDGVVNGSVVVVTGEILLGPNGFIAGDAVAVDGRVVIDGGRVGGTVSTLWGNLDQRGMLPAPRSGMAQMRHELGISLVVLAFALALGAGVLMFGGGQLLATADTLSQHPTRSFLYGVVAQFAMLPTLVFLIVALALTVLGILLIPFAVVAFFLAVFGIGALSLLSAALVAGMAGAGKGSMQLPERQKNLRALIAGVMLFGGLWVLAALLTAIPVVGAVTRAFAVAFTWVATTAGIGATIGTRFSRRSRVDRALDQPLAPEVAWETPTPVTGIVAARKPVVSHTGEITQ